MNFSTKTFTILFPIFASLLLIAAALGNTALAGKAGGTGDGCNITSLQGSINCVKRDIAQEDSAIRKTGDVTTILTDIILWLLTLVAVLALAVLIWGGIMYILSLGDEERTRNAKRIILYAILGLLIVGASFLIIQIIQGLLVGSSTNTNE